MQGCKAPCYHVPPQKEVWQDSDGGAAAPAGHRKASPWQQRSVHVPFLSIFFSFFFGEGTTIIHLLEKAGDVVFAAGGPGERVGVGRDVGGHQFGRLVAFGSAGIPIPVVVHPKTETHKIKSLE